VPPRRHPWNVVDVRQVNLRGSITRKIDDREHSDLTLYSAQTVWFCAFFSVWGVQQPGASLPPALVDGCSQRAVLAVRLTGYP
jgi:hypothetical protein